MNKDKINEIFTLIFGLIIPTLIGLSIITVGIIASKAIAVLNNMHYQYEKDKLLGNKPRSKAIKKDNKPRPWICY
jgi:hypothetical protein